MRVLRNLIVLTLIAIVGFYWFGQHEPASKQVVKNCAAEKSFMLQEKTPPEIAENSQQLEGDLFHWIGRTEEELERELGEPDRKDLSAYQYVWWVYTDQHKDYIQFGVEEGKVRTVYGIGSSLPLDQIQIGDSYEKINREFLFRDEVVYTDGVSSFSFRMTPEDMVRRPLVKLTDDLFVQFYFDTFTNELSSVRLMEGEVLLRHQPYEIVYRGMLPERGHFSDTEWNQIERGMEQQIFDISNVIRHRFGKDPLLWEEEVSEVAYMHSKDMNDNNYFSHFSLSGDGLKERLAVTGIFYLSAGENIAAQYPDAPSAVEGWLNSESHREALLLDEYTHLGVGVHRFYYTQNFLAKPL